MLLLVLILACSLQLVPGTSGHLRRSRLLLQDDTTLTFAEANAIEVKALKAVKNGDQKERNIQIMINYFFIGCGGKTRARNPEDVAADLLAHESVDTTYIDAGVVDTSKEVIDAAMVDYHHSPPTVKECDDFYHTVSGRHLLHHNSLMKAYQVRLQQKPTGP